MEKVFRENYDNNDNDYADSHDELNDDGRKRLLRWSYDEGNTEMDGNNDDAYAYDNDYYCYYDDIMRAIVLGIRSCGTVGKKNLTIGHLLNSFDTT